LTSRPTSRMVFHLTSSLISCRPRPKQGFRSWPPRQSRGLISVSIKRSGKVPFNVGGTSRKAIDYVLHVELGGLAGVIAPIIGKQSADYHIWILEGASPAFIREEGQLYEAVLSGASNKSAPHSPIKFTDRNFR